MVRENMRKWIALAKDCALDPTGPFFCPECETGKIRVEEVKWPDGKNVDKYFKCDNCGKVNVLTLKIENL